MVFRNVIIRIKFAAWDYEMATVLSMDIFFYLIFQIYFWDVFSLQDAKMILINRYVLQQLFTSWPLRN